jgi:hypothetical protein
MKWLGGVYAAAVLVLVARFAWSTPEIATPLIQPFEVPRRGFVLNLAARSAGARVQVSDYDVYRGSHPLYAIDEEPSPAADEQWASLPHRDGSPAWLDVILAARSDVRWVKLALAGSRADSEPSARDFDLVCVRAGAEIGRARVRGNVDARPRVLLGCPSTDRVRLEIRPAPPPLDRARLYEIEVWGAVQ